jgi:hypothetical protein
MRIPPSQAPWQQWRPPSKKRAASVPPSGPLSPRRRHRPCRRARGVALDHDQIGLDEAERLVEMVHDMGETSPHGAILGRRLQPYIGLDPQRREGLTVQRRLLFGGDPERFERTVGNQCRAQGRQFHNLRACARNQNHFHPVSPRPAKGDVMD